MQFDSPTSTKNKNEKNMTTLHLRKSIGPECFRGCLLIALALCCFALAPDVQAVTPAPDGGYPGGNTAEGQNALQSLTSGTNNTATGLRALFLNTSGVNNTAAGSQALLNNTTGGANTANGYVALVTNTSGGSNTATGSGALHGNTSASHNTATGYISLYNNTTGSFNTATGDRALYSNTTGNQNTANGYQALNSNTTGGHDNTATGYVALNSNTTGTNNTANGSQALYNNTTGVENTATGFGALYFNTSDDNTATGFQALNSNTTGFQNTANGAQALYFNTIGDFNTAIGFQALYNIGTGLNNVAVGEFAGGNLTADDGQNIDIGHSGFAGDNRTTRIGASQLRAFIAGIYGATASGGIAVYVNSDGQLGTATSSARFKQNIQSMDKASDVLLALRPVTFRYKPEIDPQGIPQFGLVAEEVAKVNPDLVARDAKGEPYTVRYDAVNAMLLNEFLKEHSKVEEQDRTVQEQKVAITQLKSAVTKQEATIAAQQKRMEVLTASLKEQASQIQKVSAQLELNKPAPRTVLNNQ
jgi:uncharacterized coiled-coil protein SlyX